MWNEAEWEKMSQIWTLVLISPDDSVGFLPWWAGPLRQRRTSRVITCWFPHQFKADLTAEARGAITACPEDLWHIQENVKGAYCCWITVYLLVKQTEQAKQCQSEAKITSVDSYTPVRTSLNRVESNGHQEETLSQAPLDAVEIPVSVVLMHKYRPLVVIFVPGHFKQAEAAVTRCPLWTLCSCDIAPYIRA